MCFACFFWRKIAKLFLHIKKALYHAPRYFLTMSIWRGVKTRWRGR